MADIKLNIVTATNMQGLNQLEAKLKDLKKLAESGDSVMVGTYSAVEIQKTVNAVNTLQHALRAAYDTKLNTVNIEKFNQYLTKSKMSVQDLYINLSRMGAEGRKIFMDMTQQTLMMGRSVKKTNALITEMQTTMKNTVKWGISSGLWNNMLSSVSQAWTYVKGLNSDLNDIRIVTGKSADQMERFAKTANKTAKELAVSTRDYTQGALLYYQQGDDEETVKTKTDITAKTSNVTGQDMSTVSEQLTAVWNGYQVANQAATEGMQVYEQYVDKLAAVAATTASDLEEQATAMSKVASAAYSMGVGFDDLNAQIATIESVTRQAPESVGTALKTIYARLGDLKVDGVDEFGVKLGEVSSQLKIMGVDILDSNGNMKDMSIIMEDVASKWQLWTREQKQAAAIAMAGKRQYNNLFALFENQDMYNKALSTSMEANGTLSEQQAIAVDDLDSKLQRLSTSTENFYDALFDEESIGGMIDGLTAIMDKVSALTTSLGGLGNILPMIGGILLKSFSGDIGNTIATKIANNKIQNREVSNDKAKMQLASQLGDEGNFLKEDVSQEDSLMAQQQTAVVKNYQEMMKYRKNMTDEELAAYNIAMKNRVVVANTKNDIQDQINALAEKNQLSEEQYDIISKLNKNEKLTDKEEEELNILKEKVKQQQLLVEHAREQVLTDKLPAIGVGIELSRDRTITDLAQESSQRVETAVQRRYQAEDTTSMTDEQKADLKNSMQQDVDTINRVLEQAREKGLSAGEAIKLVREELEETSNIEYGELALEDIRKGYQKIQKETEKFGKNVENVFDEHIGQSLKEAFGDDADDIIKDLKKKIVDLTKEGKRFEDAYVEALESMGEQAIDVQQALQEVDISNIDLDNANLELQDMLDTQSLKSDITDLSNAAGGFIQIWGSVGSIFSAVKNASDPAMDSLERFKSIIGSFAVSIPMLISGISSLIVGWSALKNITDGLTLSQLKDLAITKLINSENGISLLLTKLLVKEKGAKLTAETLETAKQQLQAGATWAQVAANLGLQASMWPLLAIALLLVAAFAGLALAAAAVADAEAKKKQAYADSAEAAQRELDAQKALTQAAIEHKDAIVDVVSIYDDLSEQYKNNEISLGELRSQIAQALSDYGMYDEALKALISDYDELNTLLENQEKATLEDVVNNAKKELSLTDDNAVAQVENYIADSQGSNVMEDGGWIDIDFNGTAGHQDSAMEMYDILSDDYNVDVSGGEKISSKDLAKLAENDETYYDVLNDLNNISDKGEEVRMIIDALKKSREVYEASGETSEALAAAAKDLAVLEADIENISDFDSYYWAVDQMAYDTKDTAFEGNEAEAQKWAASALQNEMGTEGQRFALEYEIITNIANKEDKPIDEVFLEMQTQLNEMSQGELEFLVNLDWDTSNLEKFNFNEIANFEDAKENVDLVESLITKTEELTDSELDSLFNNKQFESFIGMSKEEFDILNFSHQKQLMKEFYQSALIEVDNYKNAAKESAVEISDALIQQKEEQLANYENSFNNIFADLTGFKTVIKGSYQNQDGQWTDVTESDAMDMFKEIYTLMEQKSISYDAALTELWDKYINDTGSKEYVVLENIVSSTGQEFINSEEITNLFDNWTEDKQKLIEAEDKKIQAALDQASEIEGYEHDYKIEVQIEQEGFKNASTDLENFASEYQSLNGIIEDYNQNGGYTVDNLMALTSMSAEMLACLEFENGALKINADALKQVALAKVDDSIATTLSTAQKRLEALATGDLNAAEVEAIKTTAIHTYEVDRLSGALQGGEEALRSYLEELSNLTGEQSTDYNKYSGQIIKDAEAALIPLMDLREQINNNDFSLIGDTSAKDKELKILDDEFDRYWDLNKAIEKTSQAIDELADAQDKLTRGELQDNLREQNKLLEEQTKNYENLRKEQEKEAEELRGKLLNFGVDFANDGSIANYAEATEQALEYYNNAVERRQRGEITDAQLEIAEKTYDAFKESLERYDELYYSEMIETTENIADTQKQILENSLEDFEVGIQIVIDEEDFNRNLNDFLEQANNDITKHFEDLNSKQQYISFDVQSYQTSLDATLKGYAQVAEEVKKLANGQSSTMFESLSQAQEKLKELTEDSIEYASNIGDAFEEAWDNYLEGIDQADDQLQEAMEGYERINETLEYQAELIELIYGPEAYDLLDALYKQQQNNSLSQIQSLKAQKDMWAELYAGAAEGSEDQAKYFELMNEAQSQLNENVTAYIELLKNEYANTIDNILSKLENTLANGSTFEDIGEQWERLTEHTDKYYDSLESIYHIQTLSNNVVQDIANMSDVKDQQKLQKVLDAQLTSLREKENLSQTDLDIAQKKLDIAKAEIALEDARASKNSMRLTRGSDGNWFYQYIADAENVATKQQELMDLQHDLYQLNQDAYTSTIEALTNLEQTTLEKWKEIATSEVLNQEEKEAKIAELLAYYTEQKDLLVEESEIYKQGLTEATAGLAWSLYQSDADNFEEMTDTEQELVLALQDTTVNSYADIEEKVKKNLNNIGDKAHTVATENIPELTSAAANFATEWVRDEDGVRATVQKAIDDMMAAMDQFQIKVDGVASVVEGDFGEEGIKGAIDSTTTATQAAETAITNLCNNTPSKLASLKTNVDSIAGAWKDVKDQIEAAVLAFETYYNLKAGKPPKEGNETTVENTGSGNNSGYESIGDNIISGGDIQGVEDPKPEQDNKRGWFRDSVQLYVSPNGGKKYTTSGQANFAYIDNSDVFTKGTPYPVYVETNDKGKSGYISKEVLDKANKYDTGGYTGEWGTTGKVGILHEKEIILNKEDTKNILAAVNGIRQFSSVESAITKGVASMIMNMAGMGVNANYNTNEAKGNQTEQVFNITAEFPNANNVSEIREAILSLPGLASQQVGLNLI